jgi:glutamate/tyrosine decarboxylase-like PLP-dependent enzyme
MDAVLQQAAAKMQDNYPYHHPLYAGQMLKPPHPIARMAYAMSMWINPNNHALDGGRASSAMELECVAALGDMFGLEQPLGHLCGGGTMAGHLCGGGTMANLEALWVSGQLKPGRTIVASSQAHYTHSRISEVLGLRFSDKVGQHRYGGRYTGYDRHGRRGPPARHPRPAAEIRFPVARRRRVWRVFSHCERTG